MQNEEFVRLNGEIGEIYDEHDWMLRFGFFCTGYSAGYDAALKEQGAQPLQTTNSQSDAIALALQFIRCHSQGSFNVYTVQDFIKWLQDQLHT